MSKLVLVDSSYWIRLVARHGDPFDELEARGDEFDFAINGIIWAEVIRGRSDPSACARFEEGFSTMIFRTWIFRRSIFFIRFRPFRTLFGIVSESGDLTIAESA